MSDGPTSRQAGEEDAREAVRRYAESGVIDIADAQTLRMEPLPILTPERAPAGWFVGLVEGDRLLGFVQLDADLRYRRASTFGTPQLAADWLDPGAVAARARELIRPDETAGEPFFSFDVNPDRLGWIVPVEAPAGSRRLMVVGESAFELTQGGGLG